MVEIPSAMRRTLAVFCEASYLTGYHPSSLLYFTAICGH